MFSGNSEAPATVRQIKQGCVRNRWCIAAMSGKLRLNRSSKFIPSTASPARSDAMGTPGAENRGLEQKTTGRLQRLRRQRVGDRDDGRRFERGGDADEQLADLDLEAAGDALEDPGRGVFLAAFDLGEVGDGDVGALGDLLEGQAPLRALGAQGLPDCPEEVAVLALRGDLERLHNVDSIARPPLCATRPPVP